jgi:multidrug efflux pump
MIIISGIYAYIVIPKEQVPDVKIPIIMVGTSLSGISPEDSERLLLKPMENGLRSVENVQEMMSIATEGRAYLILKFDAGFDNKKALDDVRSKLDNIVIPRDAEKVTASEVNLSLFPVLNLVISGDLDNRSLLAIAREVKKSIEALPNVLKADIGGYRKDIIEVLIDPKILFTYNLDLNQVIQILTRNNQLIAAGNFAESGYSVKINGIIKNIDDIMNIPVQVNGDSVITIKDVAKVRQIFEDHVSYARVNGKQALVLEISKRTGKNIIETIDQVKYVVDQAKLYLPGSVSFIYSFDQSKDIIDMLNDLKNNIILAVLFVVIIMTIFMGIKTSTIVAITIPGSFLIGVLTVYYMGFTMNIVVLFSLILSIGMLVDASIIVNEYADRKMTVGLQPEEAYRMAAT